MERYHGALGGLDGDKLASFTSAINKKRWTYSPHFFEQVRARFTDSDQRELGALVQGLILQAGQCFEYYVEAGQIVKACYSAPFNSKDYIILVVTAGKKVLTVYRNAIGDSHKTLGGGAYDIR